MSLFVLFCGLIKKSLTKNPQKNKAISVAQANVNPYPMTDFQGWGWWVRPGQWVDANLLLSD